MSSADLALPAGDPFGTHRVLEPRGALPQPAARLDADFMKRFTTEIVVDVETLNVDAASFRQMEEASDGREEGIAALVRETVARRGKQHNPVTGSGGMLLGRVSWVGERAAPRGFAVGDRVATLASLSLTPLRLDRIVAMRRAAAQLDVEGQAAIFLSAPMSKMPEDFPDRLALALLDVAGAPPQVARHASEGQEVVILGAGGKSGLLCAVEARRRVGPRGKVIGVEAIPAAADELRALGPCDAVIVADARDPVGTREAVLGALGSEGAHLTVSCVNVTGAEIGAALVTRDRGKVFYFATSTSFTGAALGAEGCGRDVDLFIGNGYCHGHADHTLALVRASPALRALLERRYA